MLEDKMGLMSGRRISMLALELHGRKQDAIAVDLIRRMTSEAKKLNFERTAGSKTLIRMVHNRSNVDNWAVIREWFSIEKGTDGKFKTRYSLIAW